MVTVVPWSERVGQLGLNRGCSAKIGTVDRSDNSKTGMQLRMSSVGTLSVQAGQWDIRAEIRTVDMSAGVL